MYWTRLIADFTDIFLFFCQNQQKNQGKSERVLTKNDPTNCFYFDKKFAPKILLDFLIFCCFCHVTIYLLGPTSIICLTS